MHSSCIEARSLLRIARATRAFVVAVCAFILLAPTASAYTTTVHFAVRTDGIAGDGSPGNPHNWVSQTNFDSIINALPPDTCIQLEAGEFVTAGIVLQPNCALLGRGQGVTVVKLAKGTAVGTGAFPVIRTAPIEYAGTIRVQDLTADANLDRQTLGSAYVGGVTILSQHGIIRNVDVIGAYSSAGEYFPVTCFNQDPALTTDTSPGSGMIENVTVYDARGNMTTISSFSQASGITTDYYKDRYVATIRNCKVFGNPSNPANIAFMVSGHYGLVKDCYAYEVNAANVSDTHAFWNITWENVVVENIRGGGYTVNGNNPGQYKNFKFVNCRTAIKPGSELSAQHYNVYSPDMKDFVIEGCVLEHNGVAVPYAYYAFNVNVAHGEIRNCVIDNGLFLDTRQTPVNCRVERVFRFDGNPAWDVFVHTGVWVEYSKSAFDPTGGSSPIIVLGTTGAYWSARFDIDIVLTGSGLDGFSQRLSGSFRMGYATEYTVGWLGPQLPSTTVPWLVIKTLPSGDYLLGVKYNGTLPANGRITLSYRGTPLQPTTDNGSGALPVSISP